MSQYTNTEPIRKRLTDITQFEWGFKLVSITEEDAKSAWLHRARAEVVYAPKPLKDIAISAIGEQFEPSIGTVDIHIPGLTNTFLFMEPEHTYKKVKAGNYIISKWLTDTGCTVNHFEQRYHTV